MSLENFLVIISCDGPAFQDKEDDGTPAKSGPHEYKIRREVADILQQIAQRIQSGIYEGVIYDSAGNNNCAFFFE